MLARPQRRLDAVASPTPFSARSRRPAPTALFTGQLGRSPAPATVVHAFPTPAPRPTWLIWGQQVQRGTACIASGLVLTVMGVYSWTVYTQQEWSRAYQQLEQIQQNEQQMVAAIAGLKGQMTQQAEGSGLVPLSPTNAIVVTPAAQRDPAIALSPAATTPLPLARISPLGY